MNCYPKNMVLCACVAGLMLVGAGCGEDQASHSDWSVEEGDGSATEYGSNTTVVTTPGQTDTSVIVSGDPDQCVEVEDACVDLEEAKSEKGGQYCEDPDAQADVIVVDGEVVDVICYPPKDEGTDIREAETDAEGNAEVPQTNSGSVVTFAEDTDGEAIEGDVIIDAERTTLYGNGPEKTFIDGKIIVRSNNSRIRGMTVTGNIEYEGISNQSALSFCKIHGDLIVKSNGFTATNCQVWGKVTVSGNGATLMNVGVQGAWEVNSDAECHGCYSFDDVDEDYMVVEDEIGEELLCEPGEPVDVGGGTRGM